MLKHQLNAFPEFPVLLSAFGPAADLQKWQELTALIITTGSSSPLTYLISNSYQPFSGHLQDLR